MTGQELNALVVAEALKQTLSEINGLLGSDRPENWTKDGILNRIRELQAIADDHKKKSNQVKKLRRKLKSKAKTTIRRDKLLNELSFDLEQLQKSGLGLVDGSDDSTWNYEMGRREGKINAMEDVIGMIKHM